MIDQEFECELLGINKQELAIELYPNPTSDVINIVNTSALQLEGFKIYDMNGRLIREVATTNNHTQTINLSDLSSGVYMIHIYNDQLNTVKRVIKK
ncbi:MAG: T9SS type A sorting domain-containing protein [Flavobacteriaceae bacterium]|nr:T9SS type A sorting domain-containing protein [Flavobacteriaceae bacterium]